jgi:hypothetical protein
VSTDWQSLTFCGERHTLEFRVGGSDAAAAAQAMTAGLEEAEFALPGRCVADIVGTVGPCTDGSGATGIRIEALTVDD